MTDTPFWKHANYGIIGLGPEPWDDPEDSLSWPTEGFDGPLMLNGWRDPDEPIDGVANSGQTREEWLALADEMIRRWTAWRAHVASL